MRNAQCAFPSLLLATFALALAIGPIHAQAQLREGATSSAKDGPSVEGPSAERTLPDDSTARRQLPPLHAIPPPTGRPPSAPLAGVGSRLQALPDSGLAPRSVSLPPTDPERLSPNQNLLWGTVGLALSLFCESDAVGYRPARGDEFGAHRPPATWRPRGPAPHSRCDACDRARGRSMGAFVRGLFNIGSYTKLK